MSPYSGARVVPISQQNDVATFREAGYWFSDGLIANPVSVGVVAATAAVGSRRSSAYGSGTHRRCTDRCCTAVAPIPVRDSRPR